MDSLKTRVNEMPDMASIVFYVAHLLAVDTYSLFNCISSNGDQKSSLKRFGNLNLKPSRKQASIRKSTRKFGGPGLSLNFLRRIPSSCI